MCGCVVGLHVQHTRSLGGVHVDAHVSSKTVSLGVAIEANLPLGALKGFRGWGGGGGVEGAGQVSRVLCEVVA